jgi:hypothetical protein
MDLHRRHTRRYIKGNSIGTLVGRVSLKILIINSEGNASKGSVETLSVDLVRDGNDANVIWEPTFEFGFSLPISCKGEQSRIVVRRVRG